MSFFEWFGESRQPGPIGTIERGVPDPGHWHPRVILARAIAAAILLAGVLTGIVWFTDGTGEAVVAFLVVGAYCSAGYWYAPRPDLENVGWLGGLVDHPFRWSDDVNRGLLVLRVVLGPGRFVTVSLRDAFRYRRGQRVIVLPPRDREV